MQSSGQRVLVKVLCSFALICVFPPLNNCIIFSSCIAMLWIVDHFLQEETVTQVCEGLAQMSLEAEEAGSHPGGPEWYEDGFS